MVVHPRDPIIDCTFVSVAEGVICTLRGLNHAGCARSLNVQAVFPCTCGLSVYALCRRPTGALLQANLEICHTGSSVCAVASVCAETV